MRLAAEQVHKRFGSVTALDGLSLQIPEETTFGILGMNGAGKTTLFRLFVGLDSPDRGRVTIGDDDVADAGYAIRERIGYLPERIGFPDGLTGREVLQFQARMRGIDATAVSDRVLDTVGLSASDAHRPCAGYSNGMRRRLGLGCAVLSNPEVLILDEPTSGLDPRGMVEFHRIVHRARKRTGATLVVASHVLSEVEAICDRVAVIDDGATVASGDVDELVDSDELEVRLKPAGDDQATLKGLVDPFGEVTSSHTAAVVVQTSVRRLPELFARLNDTIELADVTVDRRGLESLFDRRDDAADRSDDDRNQGRSSDE